GEEGGGGGPPRGRHLRLLRGDRRADFAQAAGGAPDRHALGRGAGASRAARAHLPRRVTRHAAKGGSRGTKWRMARADTAPSAALAIAGQGLGGGRFNRLAISCSRLS